MAKKNIKEQKYLCDDCQFFTDKCEHKSNIIIKLHRRIEKIDYICKNKKRSCAFYIEK